MFDIGIGELIALGVIGLLVFGPEKLPRAAADASKWLKQIRGMAVTARKDLADSAGVDFKETMDSVKSLSDYHPRKLASSLFTEDPDEDTPQDSAETKKAPSFDPDAT
ncbi:MAG: twin-arginine translocase TatA/TatE family subunit [Candidatus Nanopelagicales bacterium]|nr:twin-arginine translocase TatA/TatE family subunit [Candidatus Nanopelagicales bacterium]MCF8540062.1 twin-arginine translocase TatA/TatE family subunit [Candidatus Nanopelagicales bacterium]MCF8551290.1 twin-arginine translocase TatA/TatE family subunit [Candidatus Nanopelagicales bacterium]